MKIKLRRNAICIARRHCAGVTLIESLIALLILSIGILGLATLQTASMNFNNGANQRTQATMLAYDMVDRLRANRQAAIAGAYIIAVQDPAPACAAPNVVGTVAQQDISTWRSALACRLPSGTGSITRNVNEFTVTVRWGERNEQRQIVPMNLQVTSRL